MLKKTIKPPLTRSEVMSRVRSKNTKPELAVRSALWNAGLRYRLHAKLPGKPDIVIKKDKAAIFVHGCFWHGHKGCAKHRIPKTRSEWWKQKILNNSSRDKRNIRSLRKMGWRVFIVWECQIEKKDKISKVIEKIIEKLSR